MTLLCGEIPQLLPHVARARLASAVEIVYTEALAIPYHASRVLWIGILLLFPNSLPCHAAPAQEGGQPVEDKLTYEVRIDGAPSDETLETFRAISETIALRDEPPASRAHLRRRMNRDRDAFLKALHSLGYYGATIEKDVDDSTLPLQVQFAIDAGNPYILTEVSIVPVETRESTAPPLPIADSLGLKTGAPLRAREVLAAEAELLKRVRELGYPFPEIANREVVVDHAAEDARVAFHLDTGTRRRFGEVRVKGLADVKEDFVRTNLGWSEGEWYKQSLLNETQTKLYRTQLFAIVRVEPLEAEGQTEGVPIVVDLVEREHRTIAAGLQYYTDTGFDVSSRWEHRNIQGRGRKVTLNANIGQTRQRVSAAYVIPFFRRDDQRLVFETELKREDLDAYLTRRFSGLLALERMLSEHVDGRIGIAYEFDRVTQLDDTDSYHLVSVPASIKWTTVDNALDPTTGSRASLLVQPFVDVTDPETHFLKTETEASHFIPVGDSRDLVVAFRMKFGVIAGADRDSVPPDQRFYAGGGGSVRGYPYRTISPLSDEDDPIGGRSILESAVELRKKITETVGFVIFIDGGSVSESSFPDFGSSYFLGAGAGARYYSPVGPIRLDIAIPLDRRSGIDDAFEIYVSLGQAF